MCSSDLAAKPAAVAPVPVPNQPAADDTTNLVSTAAVPAAGAEATGLDLPDVPALVLEQAPAADGNAAMTQAGTNPASVANPPPQVAARTHAGVLHLDTQLPVHSPRFGEGFTQQVVVLAQNGIQQAQMSLNPPDLGPIDVRITVQQDAATVQIAAASAVAREAIATAISLCSRSSTAGGVPRGANSPVKLIRPENFTPASWKVGTSGSAAARRGPLTASSRTLPPRTWPRMPGVEATWKSMVPESIAIVASPAPLNGT